MLQETCDYINDNFPEYWSDINIRFELGNPYRNGSKKRIDQVNKRVNIIFEELFKPNDVIYVLIKDWGANADPMFGNTTPDYLYEILQDRAIERETFFEIDEEKDDNGNSIQVKNEYQLIVLSGIVSSIPYKKIFEGISHYEQGREPSIGQKVYFLSREKNILFHMYDDRGCIAYALSVPNLKILYTKYNDWIVDYWREYMDGIFKN
ncbi:hypothetical protein BSK48_27410 [Paenibacillus odorifer]|jgi:hypothetical protein|uniref:DUF3885 domain-containing protein n=1 Tax=Paenibacillus TaxID=44249 RepID=UPI00096EF183|nr:DUF3885 domain-containing protein [Paenibacillus odorifer]OMD62912.1 hypothetical protein BSK48_27410 [Paenibacillus odorifer]